MWSLITALGRYKVSDEFKGPRIGFRIYSPTANAGTRTDYYETYHLPEVAEGLTSNKTYDIYTSKDGVPWSKITNTPSSYTPASHTHGNITDSGTIGTAGAVRAVTLNTSNKIIASDLTVSAPSASGTGTAFITSVSQAANGKISASKASLPTASTDTAGIIQIGTGSTNAMAGNTTVTNVTQETTTTSSWRKIMLSGGDAYAAYNTDVGDSRTAVIYMAKSVSVQPSTGKIQAAGFIGPLTGDVTGNASTATTLATAREIYVALGSTRDSSNPVTFNGSAAKAIHVSGTLPVTRGGTGATTFTSGEVLIGAGTGAITTKSITNNTSVTAVTASSNLITANTLYYHKGNSNIVTVGTITNGTWNGNTIGVGYGGTGGETPDEGRHNLNAVLHYYLSSANIHSYLNSRLNANETAVITTNSTASKELTWDKLQSAAMGLIRKTSTAGKYRR